MIRKNILGAVLAVLFLASSSYAQDSTEKNDPPQAQGSGVKHSHHGPSKAAINACLGKSKGDACDYTNSRGEDRPGTCAYTRNGQTLFCKKNRKASS